MIRDTLRKAISRLSGRMGDLREEDFKSHLKIKGEVFWELRNTTTKETTKGHFKNIVVLDASILIARLLKGTGGSIVKVTEPNFGIYALGVGTGDVSWDPMNPPPATNTQRSLWNEIGRKKIQSSSFIDSSGNVSSIPTNVVDFTTVFSESEAVGPLVEMALLGGDISTNMAVTNPILPPSGAYDATYNVVGKDMMANYLTYPVINKPPTSTLSFTWRISL